MTVPLSTPAREKKIKNEIFARGARPKLTFLEANLYFRTVPKPIRIFFSGLGKGKNVRIFSKISK